MSNHEKSIALMRWLSAICQKLDVAEHTYVVGGAVRNFVLQAPIKDLDIAIDSIRARRDSEWLARQIQMRIPVESHLVTNAYGVAILTVKGNWEVNGVSLKGEVLEIANARMESYGGEGGKGYKPHAVAEATIEEDLARREFSFNCLAGDTLIPTEKGILRIDEIANRTQGTQQGINLQVAGRDGASLAIGWQYSGRAPTLQVTTEWGHSFSGTHHHPALVLRGHDHVWVQTNQIVLGDLLCVPTQPLTRDSRLTLALSDTPPPKHGALKVVNKPEYMTPDLAYVMGCVVSEGSNTSRRVFFSNSNQSFIAKYIECFDKVFGFRPKPNKITTRGTVRTLKGVRFVSNMDGYSVYADSKSVVFWLKELGLYCDGSKGGKTASHHKVVPWSIMQADERSQHAFLAAYLEGDGGIIPQSGRMFFCSASKHILRHIQILLGAQGILSKVSGRFVYLNAVDSAVLWTKIYPWMTTKKFDYNQRGYKSRNRYGLPKEYLQNLLRLRQTAPGNNRGPATYQTDDGKQVPLMGLLETLRLPKLLLHDAYERGDFDIFLSNLQAISPTEHAKVLNIFRLKYQYVKVTSIVDAGEQDVFDISMSEGVEPAFVANGLVVHNTLMWRLKDLASGPDKAEILDLMGCGLEDLRKGEMRCPGDNPVKTFSDDPTRIIRAIKFAIRYGFKLTPDTLAAVKVTKKSMASMPHNAITKLVIDVLELDFRKAVAMLQDLDLVVELQGIVKANKAAGETLSNWAGDRLVSENLTLMDIGLPCASWMTRTLRRVGVIGRFRAIMLSLSDSQAREWCDAVMQPGRVLPMDDLIRDFNLSGREIRRVDEALVQVLLDHPRWNVAQLERAVREILNAKS